MSYVHKFTATQRKILAVLADGERHHCDELLNKCSVPNKQGVRVQLTQMRKILRIIGEEVICEYWERRLYYRHIRLLPRANGFHSPTREPIVASTCDPSEPARDPMYRLFNPIG